jgi:hypothetical protein
VRAGKTSTETTSDTGQPRARYVLSSTVRRYGYSRRSTNSCIVLDPLGAQAVHQLGHISVWGGEDVLCESTSYIFKFYLFLVLLRKFLSLSLRNIFVW